MKKYLLLFAAVLTAFWGFSETIQFDAADEFTSNFIINDDGAAGTNEWSASAGIGGISGRIDTIDVITTSGKGIYTEETVNPDGGPITASFFFLAAEFTSTTASRVALGLSPDRVNLRASSEVQVRLLKNGALNATFEVRDGISGTISGQEFAEVTTAGVVLTDDHWYKMTVTFATYGSSSMEVDATLVDYGTNGTVAGSTIATAKAARNDPLDFGNTGSKADLYIGILAQDDGGGSKAIDNVYVPWITEPPTYPDTTETFSAEAGLTNNFDILSGGGTVIYNGSAIGAGGEAGRVDTAVLGGSGKGLYTKEQADPDDGAITASFYFLASEFTTTDDSRIALGLSPDQDNLVGNNEVQMRLLKNGDTNATFEVRGGKNDSDGENITTAGVTLQSNHWYKMEGTFSAWGSGSMELTGSITDYGLDGIIAGSVIATVKGGKTVDANFLDNGDRLPLHIGILAQNDGGGAVAIDNVDAPLFTNTVIVLLPYDTWSAGWTVDIGTETNDYDLDGLNNLLEYALNGNPTNDDAAAVSPVGFMDSASGTNYLYYVHAARTDDNSLTYSVGTATALTGTITWNTNDVFVVGESPVVDSYKTVTNRTEAAEAAKFMGLTVQK